MSSLYPGGLDNFAEASPTYMSDPDTTGRVHSARHDDVEAAVEAIQGFIGARKSAAAVPAQVYWDETVGRRCFAWDTVNNRWQMIYGDTGWRNVSTGMTAPTNCTIDYLLVRRVGNAVAFQFRGIISGAMAGTGVYVLPNGFRMGNPSGYIVGRHSSSTKLGALQLSAFDRVQWADSLGNSPTAGDGALLSAGSFVTNDTWPTALPGTASGAIPTALAAAPPTAKRVGDAMPIDVDPFIPTGLPYLP